MKRNTRSFKGIAGITALAFFLTVSVVSDNRYRLNQAAAWSMLVVP